MLTVWGAEALGWAEETGSLESGKSADLVVIALEGGGKADPLRVVLESSAPVKQVMCRGVWLSA
jgi:cytosine/adenosine deaminase-related metal-dependent hydrolase